MLLHAGVRDRRSTTGDLNARLVLTRFPPIEPYAQGVLDVGDGQQLYLGDVRQPRR